MPTTKTSASIAEAVRQWVADAPEDSVLDPRDAPGGPSNAARLELSRLGRDPAWPLWLVRKNLYWRGAGRHTYWDDWPKGGPVDWGWAAVHAGGAGSGWAGYSAAKLFGWTHQVMIAPHVAVVGQPPRGFDDNVLISSRSNTARKTLNVVEVSLIEAITGFETSGAYQIEYKYGHSHYCMWDTENPHPDEDCLWDWPDAVEHLADRLRERPLTHGQPIHPQRLAAAAPGERIGGLLTRRRIHEIADVVADAQRTNTLLAGGVSR